MSIAAPSSDQRSNAPLGIGQIIADAFRVSLRNYGWVFLLNLAVMAIFLALLGSFFWAAWSGDRLGAQAIMERNFGLFWLLFAVAGFLSLAFYCAMIRLIHDRHIDPNRPFLTACLAGARRFLPAFGLMLIYLLAYIVLYLIMGVVAMVLAAIGLPIAVLIPIFFALGIFALYLVFPYLLSFVICVNEDLGPIRSLRRSRYLSNGFRWPLFGLMLLSWVIWLAYAVVSNILVRLLGVGAGGIVAIVMTLALPLLYAWLIGMYSIAAHRLRLLKDGFDDSRALGQVFE
ncbi:DUF975 family protein [Labrys neptuniae]